MTTRTTTRVWATAGALLSILLAPPVARAQTQSAVITGKVTSEAGQPIAQANVYINDLSASVATNDQGVYTITIAAARVQGQAVNLRVRAIGYQPGVIPIRITAGTQTQNFSLKQDVNRLNEVVVTGVVGETGLPDRFQAQVQSLAGIRMASGGGAQVIDEIQVVFFYQR